MIIWLLALIGALFVMVVLTIGRLWFGRREGFVGTDICALVYWVLHFQLPDSALHSVFFHASVYRAILGLAMGTVAVAFQ